MIHVLRKTVALGTLPRGPGSGKMATSGRLSEQSTKDLSRAKRAKRSAKRSPQYELASCERQRLRIRCPPRAPDLPDLLTARPLALPIPRPSGRPGFGASRVHHLKAQKLGPQLAHARLGGLDERA